MKIYLFLNRFFPRYANFYLDWYAKKNDVRNRTKEYAVHYLWKAELHYLFCRGWIILCGTNDDSCFARNNDRTLSFTHEEALAIQKTEDALSLFNAKL